MTQVNLRSTVMVNEINTLTNGTTNAVEGIGFTGIDGNEYELFATPIGSKGVIHPEQTPGTSKDGVATGVIVYGGTEYKFVMDQATTPQTVKFDTVVYSFDSTTNSPAKLFSGIADLVKSLGASGDIDVVGSI